ncbi:MAG: flagellar biosynthetic protein FliP [Limisphaerales bacterium]|jgi:flagellar biosynthetic protein FliP
MLQNRVGETDAGVMIKTGEILEQSAVTSENDAIRWALESLLRRSLFRILAVAIFLLLLSFPTETLAQATPIKINLGVEAGSEPQDVSVGIKILFMITLLSLAPSILMLMTSFTRVVIVLSFVRNALSLQGAPSNQIIVGLSLFISFFIMAPTWEKIQTEALQPYQEKLITGPQALEKSSVHIREFMLSQARPKDIELFMNMANLGPTEPEDLPLKVVIPGFIISELSSAFQMGFLIFLPFVLIDLVVATVLMSMGMMMMPPMMVSLPLKLLLFVLVDGWNLIVYSVVRSFGM